MLTCIACSKQLVDADDDGGPHGGGPGGSNKPAVKSLTSQIKDVVLKLSGVYRVPPGRGVGPSSSSFRSKAQFHRSYVQDLVAHGGVGDYYYPYGNANNNGKGGKPPHESSSSWAALEGGTHPAAAQLGGRGKIAVERSAAGFPGVLVEAEVEEEPPKEWVAQVEPGVHITFVSLPEGGNDLKRIRFSREMFNKWQAQRWWGENYDRVMELYNVQRFNKQALPTPPRSEDERDLSYSRMGSTRDSPVAQPFAAANSTAIHPYNNTSLTTNNNGNNQQQTQTSSSRPPTATSSTGNRNGPMGSPAPDPTEHFFPSHAHLLLQQNPGGKSTLMCAAAAGAGGGGGVAGLEGIGGACSSADAASRTTTSSRDDAASVSVSNASDMLDVTEWVEQDEPGVYITIRQMADGTRDLRRVRFSRERFGEVNAKLWWEENRDRIHAQYL